MTSSRRIATLLGVLDHADDAQQRRQNADVTLGRDALLDAVTQPDTAHDAADLVEGVDAYLAHAPLTTFHIGADTLSDFGWNRPMTANHQAELECRSRKRQWWHTKWMRRLGGGLVLLGIVGATLATVAGLAVAGGMMGAWISHAYHHYPLFSDRRVTISVGGFLGLFVAINLIVGVEDWTQKMRFKAYARSLISPCTSEKGTWFMGDLPRPEQDYLKHPSTRAYLRAVLGSALPRLMRGDVHHLEERFQKEEDTVAVSRRYQAEKSAQERRRKDLQAKDHARHHRMEDFAQALASPSD